MPVFQFIARDEDGRLITDRLAFRDEPSLRQHLRKNNLFVVQVAELRRGVLGIRRRVRLGDLVIMSRHLRTMILAGMPLVTGLEALSEQSTNPRLGEVLAEVARGVSTGRSLAAVMGEYPHIFPELLVTLIQSGEAGGRLPEALDEATRQLELQMEVRQKLISAAIYPVFTLVTAVCTVAAMLIFIVPVFADIYKELHATLPAPTLLLIWMSDVMVHSLWIVLLIAVALAIALRRYYRTDDGRMKIDALKLKLPLIGVIFRKSASASVTGSLAGLLESGLPLIQSIETAARVAGNAVMATALRGAGQNIVLGRKLSDELESSGQYPLMVVRMIAMAEDTGTLPEVLRQISAGYIEEVEYAVRRIMSVMEPVMVLVVAGVVGFVLVALYVPIFNLGSTFVKNG